MSFYKKSPRVAEEVYRGRVESNLPLKFPFRGRKYMVFCWFQSL